MPRLDADFLFCWTAMLKLLLKYSNGSAMDFRHSSTFSRRLLQRGQTRERGHRLALYRSGRAGRARTVFMTRCERQRQQELVFDQGLRIERSIGENHFRFLGVQPLELRRILRQQQPGLLRHMGREGLEAALAYQRDRSL